VTAVLPNSLALRVGLRPGDVLLQYNDKELHQPADLVAARGETPVPVKLWREGRTLGGRIPGGTLGVTFSKLPIKEALTAWYEQQQAEQLALRGGKEWERLPGTLTEVRLLEQLVPKTTTLLGSNASQQNLSKLAASGELARYRLLHLATHGEANSTHPENTALILSRDNLPDNAARVLRGEPPIEGVLTVGTILREWKLDADLVVLSACETGLGQRAGGEGMLGFAQALLQRGARSVVLSRWKVDDGATALLMQRFYQNVLGQREGLKAPLGRADALQEAKTWLRSLTSEQALRLLATINDSVARGPGAKPLKLVKSEVAKKDDRPYEHPFYWSAFVLLGDWR
jgi:CHAT domain-containing protein